MEENENKKFNTTKIKGIIGLIIFIGTLLYMKIDKIYGSDPFDNYTTGFLILLPIGVFSLWLMNDWAKTWFR
ncbi:hypothetical protein [Halarcobacter sp.]|uniref:hypothetical protein n=1 Tax=Halarcobacter sp. TaxID=2321133 RepID=UPI002AA69658|nr:hypothetical protein [Halarcobacter sp.]